MLIDSISGRGSPASPEVSICDGNLPSFTLVSIDSKAVPNDTLGASLGRCVPGAIPIHVVDCLEGKFCVP